MKTCGSRFIFGISTLACALSARAEETRLPIIARVQVVYSAIGHYCDMADRISYFNSAGDPAGNSNYVVPNLVYEPVVTLYNPYNTELVLPQSRVLISNPPVGFKFKKNDNYFRPEWNTGGPFLGLGRFQTDTQSSTTVQKTFTLVLGEGNSNAFGGAISLQPGQCKAFSVRVDDNWTWGLETKNLMFPRSFFDWNLMRNFTNRDGRTGNAFGVEAIRGYDWRAGFQSDNLSVTGMRPAATLYPFELPTAYGYMAWVAIKKADTFSVEARGVDTVSDPAVPDFQLSLLGGVVPNVAADTLKTYSFGIAHLDQPETQSADQPTVSRTWAAGDLLQVPTDLTAGGKKPFAIFTLAARSSALRQRKFQADLQPPSNELYEARVDPVSDYPADPDYNPGPAGSYLAPTDYPTETFAVEAIERIGEFLMLDVVAPPNSPTSSWKVKGSTDLSSGFQDDLTMDSDIMIGPPDTGIYKVRVQLTNPVDRYFIRIEY